MLDKRKKLWQLLPREFFPHLGYDSFMQPCKKQSFFFSFQKSKRIAPNFFSHLSSFQFHLPFHPHSFIIYCYTMWSTHELQKVNRVIWNSILICVSCYTFTFWWYRYYKKVATIAVPPVAPKHRNMMWIISLLHAKNTSMILKSGNLQTAFNLVL